MVTTATNTCEAVSTMLVIPNGASRLSVGKTLSTVRW